MPQLYLLNHNHSEPHAPSIKLIGIYSTLAAAQAAEIRSKGLPGFRRSPHGFQIHSLPVDVDFWPGGFEDGQPQEMCGVPQHLTSKKSQTHAPYPAHSVFAVWHEQPIDEDHDLSRLIGLFSTEKDALRYQASAQSRKGFSLNADHFILSETPIDKDSWTEGFVTMLGDEEIFPDKPSK